VLPKLVSLSCLLIIVESTFEFFFYLRYLKWTSITLKYIYFILCNFNIFLLHRRSNSLFLKIILFFLFAWKYCQGTFIRRRRSFLYIFLFLNYNFWWWCALFFSFHNYISIIILNFLQYLSLNLKINLISYLILKIIL